MSAAIWPMSSSLSGTALLLSVPVTPTAQRRDSRPPAMDELADTSSRTSRWSSPARLVGGVGRNRTRTVGSERKSRGQSETRQPRCRRDNSHRRRRTKSIRDDAPFDENNNCSARLAPAPPKIRIEKCDEGKREKAEFKLAAGDCKRHRKEDLNEVVVSNSKAVIDVTIDEIKADYSFERIVGDGNFATVYKSVDLKKGTVLAMKVDKLKDKPFCHVENEAELMSRCRHENICRFKAGFRTTQFYYLVLEFAERGDLFEAVKLRADPFGESATVAGWLADAAGALHFLDERRVAHRDVKPENLLLGRKNRLKLTDFGLACKTNGPLFRVCGTPTYVAPEILTGKGYGTMADVWSLGIIAHILLVGYAPFRNKNNNQLFKLIRAAKLDFAAPSWLGISPEAKQLISSMLCAKADSRITPRRIAKSDWIARFFFRSPHE